MNKIIQFLYWFQVWLDLTLKLLGLATMGLAIWMIQEPSVSIRKESAISILDVEAFLKGATSNLQTSGIEKRFYDSLNKGQPFSTLSWTSYVTDKNALRLCLSQQGNIKNIDVFSEERMERFNEIVAGYGKEGAEKELMAWKETCAHFTLFDLDIFLKMKYGTPFNLLIDDNKQGVTRQFYEDPLYQLIKSFENRATRNVLFQELPQHKKVVTILKLANTGGLEARDVKVRFNFTLARIKTGESLTLFGGQQVGHVLKEPIYLDGGTVSENVPNGAEVFYPTVPAKDKKFIYVITHQNNIPTGAFSLEPIPYLSRIPNVSIWWFILICVMSLVISIVIPRKNDL